MRADVLRFTPYEEFFVLEELCQQVADRREAHYLELYYTALFDSTNNSKGYNTLKGTPVANAQFWAMQKYRSSRS